MRSATPRAATWRSSKRLQCEFGCVQRSARREDEAIEAMDQASASETPKTVRSSDRVVEHESDLILRPRPLRVVIQQNFKDRRVRLGILLGHTHRDRLVLHWSSRSFATPPAVCAVRGHFSRVEPTLDCGEGRYKGFRQGFRQSLLVAGALRVGPHRLHERRKPPAAGGEPVLDRRRAGGQYDALDQTGGLEVPQPL